MGDYNLHGLNPRDFQHLVQALARKQLGGGVTAFGDGKDGARDLTFTGRMNYPSLTAPWDGYMVLGCKFCQRPTGDSKKDGDWALEQLEGDLKKFIGRKRKIPRPEYYLFVTNISLTGVADKGSRDRAVGLLQKYATKLLLKGHGIWDYNDIRGFLDGDRDLRSAYGHFVTAGDVLERMMEIGRFQGPDFGDVMHAFLQKELIADTSAKLQSAGEDPDVQIPLASVFLDLPFAESFEAATLAKQDDEAKAPKVVQSLLEAGAIVLRRLPQAEASVVGTEGSSMLPQPSRFVIVGGPGQGKSTLGQYLCQLHRGSLLRDRPTEKLDERVPGIIRQLEKQRKDFGGLPLARRFPVRVELRAFSSALAKDSRLTLLEYIRQDISLLGCANVSLADLTAWLTQYPWLIVFDGLDEVPPSSNRSDVMKGIEHFRVDAASRTADLMVVATTRPQSYSKEFSDDLYRHFYLMPLSPRHALNYGRKLAESRCGGDEHRRDELVRSLEKACRNEATARLMQSPLQVTIMATLLEETGEPPQQRYRLFAEYYRTIYKRETRRRLLGGILSERQTDIDTIHAQAGLLLMVSGEIATRRVPNQQDSEIESALSDKQFRELVRKRLEKIRVPPAKAAELLTRITDSSLQRLVFLVRPREGWVRFDITSLKEFMAAEAIMTGSDQEVRERMEAVAPATYWRNVFLFAVGKCFVQHEHMLDGLVSICADLNEEKAAARILGDPLAGRAAKAILWGSRLALEILTDGTARQYPEYEVRLARLALELVKLSDVEMSARLAAVYHEDLSELYREVIYDRLGQANFWQRIGAWNLLLSLADHKVDWAKEGCETNWPSDTQQQYTLLASGRGTRQGEWWIQRLLAIAPKINPWKVEQFLYRHDFHEVGEFRTLPDPWKTIFGHFVPRRNRMNETANHSSWRDIFPSLSVVKAHLGPDLANSMGSLRFEHAGWFPRVAGARFGANPTARVLAEELEWLAERWQPEMRFGFDQIPWPLAACLESAPSREELMAIAGRVREGRMGDTHDWSAAEQRWQLLGIVDADLTEISDDQWPFDAGIAQRGFPLSAATWSAGRLSDSGCAKDFLNRLDHVAGNRVRTELASFILSWLSRHAEDEHFMVPPKVYRGVYDISKGGHRSNRTFWLDSVALPARSSPLNAELIDLLDGLGREKFRFIMDRGKPSFAEQLVHEFCRDPAGKSGLLPVILAAAESGYRCVVPRDILELVRGWGGSAAQEANLLALAQPDLAGHEIARLIEQLRDGDSAMNSLWRGLRIAATASPHREADLALVVFESISPDSEDRAGAVNMGRRALVEYLTSRASNFDATRFCAGFSLPERNGRPRGLSGLT